MRDKYSKKEILLKNINDSMATSENSRELSERESNSLSFYALAWSLLLLIASAPAAILFGEGLDIFYDFYLILITPSKLITDYFQIGGIGASFLNAGLCGLSCNLLILISKAKPSASLLAGYFLVIAHCFYGLNLINMWPPIIGIFVFSIIMKEKFGNVLTIAMFSTSLGPFISELLFRYTTRTEYVFGEVKITILGVVLAILFGIGSGFIVPALLPGTTKMHRGHNLFKAGLAIGIYGMFAYALLFKNFGIEASETVTRVNQQYLENGRKYIWFVDAFFVLIFLGTLLLGILKNNKSFSGYKKIWHCDGYMDDFPNDCGIPLTFINIGLYGMFVLFLMNIPVLLSSGNVFAGPTVGVTIAAITFSASGQTPRNVYPIAIGYGLLSLATILISKPVGLDVSWSLSTQGYINGFAFATGLCPFAGKYGRRIGILAGLLHGILCASTASMHGGFVLYNGGLTSGLTALLLLPLLDFYHVKQKQ